MLVVVRDCAPTEAIARLRGAPSGICDVEHATSDADVWNVELGLHISAQVTLFAARYVAGRARSSNAYLRLRVAVPDLPTSYTTRLPPLPLAEFDGLTMFGLELPRVLSGSTWWYPSAQSTIVFSARLSDTQTALSVLQAVVDPQHCAADARLCLLGSRASPESIADCVSDHVVQVVRDAVGEDACLTTAQLVP